MGDGMGQALGTAQCTGEKAAGVRTQSSGRRGVTPVFGLLWKQQYHSSPGPSEFSLPSEADGVMAPSLWYLTHACKY